MHFCPEHLDRLRREQNPHKYLPQQEQPVLRIPVHPPPPSDENPRVILIDL